MYLKLALALDIRRDGALSTRMPSPQARSVISHYLVRNLVDSLNVEINSEIKFYLDDLPGLVSTAHPCTPSALVIEFACPATSDWLLGLSISCVIGCLGCRSVV